MSILPSVFHHVFAVVALSSLLPNSPSFAQEKKEPDATALPMRGFRFTTKEEAKKESLPTPPAPGPDVTGKKPDGSPPPPPASGGNMKVGIVSDQASLPPGLTTLAQEGALAVADNDWEKARRVYLDMIGLAPDNALAFANLGVAEHELGNLLAAAGNLGKSIELNPHIARNWLTLGLINYEQGDLTLAISNLTRAIHEAPDDAESRLILAAVVRDYGWPDAAVTELQRAVELNPKLASAHYNLAVTYLGMKPPRLELARRHYYAAIDLGTPASPEIEAIFKKSE